METCFAIYSRKSKFTGKGESIENQIELCRQYIENKYPQASSDTIFIYEDEGFSGKNTSRPQFKKMLQDAKKKKFTTLVCYRLDRISRNVGDFATLIEDLNKLKIDFVSIREAFDTSTSMGRAMMYIASVFAQLERETIAERIRDNMYELAKSGRWLGGTTPTGYTSESLEKITIDGKSRKAYRLKLLPEEAATVISIYDKFLETGSLTKTDAYLVQNQYTTKNNNNFSRFSIRAILTNPVYMIADEQAYQYIAAREMDLFSDKNEFDHIHGMMVYNRTLQRDGMSSIIRDPGEWIVAVGKHEGIIEGCRWVKVQELLAANSSKSYKKPRSNQALLSGILICQKCQNYLRPKLTKRYTSDGERRYDYLCTMKEKSNGKCCTIKNANGNLLDYELGNAITKLPVAQDVFIQKIEQAYQSMLEQTRLRGSDLVRYQKVRKENEKEINTLVHTLGRTAGSSCEPYLLQQIEQLHAKNEELQIKIKEEETKASEFALSEEKIYSMRKNISSFEWIYQNSEIEQKRIAVKSLIRKAVWDGERVQLYFEEDNYTSQIN